MDVIYHFEKIKYLFSKLSAKVEMVGLGGFPPSLEIQGYLCTDVIHRHRKLAPKNFNLKVTSGMDFHNYLAILKY